jgi:hypothetical protein
LRRIVMRVTVNTGKFGDLVVIAGVVAERAFRRMLVAGRMIRIRTQFALEHDFGTGRHVQIVADAFDQLGAAAAQQAGELVFGQRVRHRRHGAQNRRRIAAEHHRHRKGLPGNLRAWSRKSSAPPRWASQRMITLSGAITCCR